MLSGSARWDASNLFGVKTNQKGVPLWSAGLSWRVSDELFYKIAWLPYLKLRATYGYSGNVDKSVTAFTTVSYGTDFTTDLRSATVRSPGNPNLRWEKVAIMNFGVDFNVLNDRIQGSLEYYQKNSSDLLGLTQIDPTVFYSSGLASYKTNYANLRTRGFDIEINTRNIDAGFKWQSHVLFSHAANEVTDYLGDGRGSITSYTGGRSNRPVEGHSLDGIYSLPWAGLDSETGDPLVLENGSPTKEYTRYLEELSLEELVYHGPSVPTIFGSLRNTFSWKGFNASANITFKAGYYFRRSTINYNRLSEDWIGHRDFSERWQNPGDELSTQVPSMPEAPVSNRDQVYALSEILVEKGDHIRLQDVSLSYTIDKLSSSAKTLRNIRLYLYANNLGIIWRDNKRQLDPDYPSASILPAQSFSIGIQANF